MISLKKPCKFCEKESQLMYKEGDEDRYICTECMSKWIVDALKAQCQAKHRPHLPLDIHEAIAVHLEYANVKIQRIPPVIGILPESEATERSHIVYHSVIIESVYNGQFIVETIRTLDSNFMTSGVACIQAIINEWFQNNTYNDLIVPKNLLEGQTDQ